MMWDEIDENLRYFYQKECEICKFTVSACSKKDNDAEYYAEVFIQCGCGNWIGFDFPVN